MSNINYPKVLIISDCDYHHGKDATAITIKNIFNNWPSEKLCFIQLKSYNEFEYPEKGKLVLDSKNLKYGNLLLKIRKNQSKVTNDVPALIVEANLNKKERLKQGLRISISAWADMINYKIDGNLINFIKKETPDIIYLLPYGRRIIKLALNIHEKFNIPILPHFMDDWPTTIYNDFRTTFVQRRMTLKALNSLFVVCEKSLVISDSMKREFEERYKDSQFFSLMNDVENYIGVENNNLEYIYQNKFTLCYAGGLHLNRWTSLLALCQIMKNEERLDKINIYTSEKDWESVKNYFKEFPFVIYKGFIDQKDVLDTLKNHDCLIFIESFDENVKKYTKFSISTKIPEYLALAKPIIAVGPSDIASIDYLNKHNLAIICSEANKNEWGNTLQKKLFNESILKEKIENGKTIFFKNHYRKAQHEKFLKILYSLIKK